jgi:hypothetical protein
MKYEVKQEVLAMFPVSISLNEAGKPVNLMGTDVTVEMSGTADAPPTKRTARAATQADLAYLFKQGHPFIIESAAAENSK